MPLPENYGAFLRQRANAEAKRNGCVLGLLTLAIILGMGLMSMIRSNEEQLLNLLFTPESEVAYAQETLKYIGDIHRVGGTIPTIAFCRLSLSAKDIYNLPSTKSTKTKVDNNAIKIIMDKPTIVPNYVSGELFAAVQIPMNNKEAYQWTFSPIKPEILDDCDTRTNVKIVNIPRVGSALVVIPDNPYPVEVEVGYVSNK